MAITRIFGCNAVVAVAICGAVSGCSSVQTASKTDAAPTTDVAAAHTPEQGAQAGAPVDVASAESAAAAKSGRLPANAATIPAPGALANAATATAPAQTTTVAMAGQAAATQKSGRITFISQAADPLQRAAETAAFSISQNAQPVAVPALAVASNPVNKSGGLQAINVATAGPAPVMTRPISAPAALTHPAAPVAADNGPVIATSALPADVSASYAAIPTPRPRIQNASTSTMVAYAAPSKTVAGLSSDFFPPAPGEPIPETAQASTPNLNQLIKRYAGMYGVPESLVHRVVHRESKYNAGAYNKRGYWGLMQITYPTAKSMGYEGPASGLLDAETNLKYAIKYLRGAWLVADNDPTGAIRLYARGYYFDAKRRDMLHVLK